MSSFFVELWEGVFTPGPTPTLLKATNMSFAALQLVLLAMLLATYSIHCVVLSVLSAGLWWSVNWFATELAAHQREEDAKKRAEQEQKKVEEDSETEVETAVPDKQPVKEDAAEAGVEAVEQVGEVKQRVAAAPVAGTQSSVSTEDEWEKVSENENDKDK